MASLRPTRRQRAQDVVDCGLLLATIAIVVLLAVVSFGHLVEPCLPRLLVT